jgi:hypothetical protein
VYFFFTKKVSSKIQDEFLEVKLLVAEPELCRDKVRERNRVEEKNLAEMLREGSLERTRTFLMTLFTLESTLTLFLSSQSSSSSKTDGRVSDWQGGHSGAAALGIKYKEKPSRE